MEEYILTFPTKLLHKLCYFEGLNYNISYFKNNILNFRNQCFVERKLVEKDPNYKQVIPYGIIIYKNTVFSYNRGKKGDEERLRNNYSIGIGGHIKKDDKNNLSPLLIISALNREINEELYIKIYT